MRRQLGAVRFRNFILSPINEEAFRPILLGHEYSTSVFGLDLELSHHSFCVYVLGLLQYHFGLFALPNHCDKPSDYSEYSVLSGPYIY